MSSSEQVTIVITKHVGHIRISSSYSGSLYEASGDVDTGAADVTLPCRIGNNRFDIVASKWNEDFDVEWRLQHGSPSDCGDQSPEVLGPYSFPKSPGNNRDNETIFVEVEA